MQPVIIGDKERTLTILLYFGLEHDIQLRHMFTLLIQIGL